MSNINYQNNQSLLLEDNSTPSNLITQELINDDYKYNMQKQKSNKHLEIINKIIDLVYCKKSMPIINVLNPNMPFNFMLYGHIMKNSTYGPTRYSNQILPNFIMSALPINCSDVGQILNKSNNIGLVLSLRENDELYSKCRILKKIINKKQPDVEINLPIFWRFIIPDFGVQNPESIKSLIDSLLNYTKTTNKKVFIHCLGGHGRTGTIACCVFAIYLLEQFILVFKKQSNISNKYIGHTFLSFFDQGTFNKYKFKSEALYIRAIATAIFKISQIIIIGSLRFHRQTDSESYRKDLKQIKVPETHNQDETVINVIISYINEYITNGVFGIHVEDIEDDPETYKYFINEIGELSWPYAKNIGPIPI